MRLYQQATSGDDPDKVEMGLIDLELRTAGITLKRKAGKSAIGDGVATIEDLQLGAKEATLAVSLFGMGKKKAGIPPGPGPAALSRGKWSSARNVVLGAGGRFSGLLSELQQLQEEGETGLQQVREDD